MGDMASDNMKSFRGERSFGLMFGLILSVVALLPVLHGEPVRNWAVVPALLLFLVTWRAPRLLAWPYRLWMGIGMLLHRVTNPLLLAVVYFVVITPAGLIFRLFARKSHFAPNGHCAATYWKHRQSSGVEEHDLTRQF